MKTLGILHGEGFGKLLQNHRPLPRPLIELEGFLDVYREVTGRFPVRGNLVPDAHLAALLRQHGVRKIYTSDTDFKKFDFLQVLNPLH